MMEVQRYPSDFDWVIAGHPSMGTPQQVTLQRPRQRRRRGELYLPLEIGSLSHLVIGLLKRQSITR
jgi:hypothetical protein